MTPTTPSLISDQAAAQEAFEFAWHRYDIYPTQYRDDGEINAYSDPVKEKAWRVFRYCSTAPTTVISDQAAGEPVTRQMLEAAKEYLPDYPYPGWADDITGMYQAMRRVALNAAPCSHNYINGQCKTCGCVSAGE